MTRAGKARPRGSEQPSGRWEEVKHNFSAEGSLRAGPAGRWDFGRDSKPQLPGPGLGGALFRKEMQVSGGKAVQEGEGAGPSDRKEFRSPRKMGRCCPRDRRAGGVLGVRAMELGRRGICCPDSQFPEPWGGSRVVGGRSPGKKSKLPSPFLGGVSIPGRPAAAHPRRTGETAGK